MRSSSTIHRIRLTTCSHFPDVSGPPFIRPMRNLTAITGSDFRLHCPVSGYPIESIRIEKGTFFALSIIFTSGLTFPSPVRMAPVFGRPLNLYRFPVSPGFCRDLTLTHASFYSSRLFFRCILFSRVRRGYLPVSEVLSCHPSPLLSISSRPHCAPRSPSLPSQSTKDIASRQVGVVLRFNRM